MGARKDGGKKSNRRKNRGAGRKRLPSLPLSLPRSRGSHQICGASVGGKGAKEARRARRAGRAGQHQAGGRGAALSLAEMSYAVGALSRSVPLHAMRPRCGAMPLAPAQIDLRRTLSENSAPLRCGRCDARTQQEGRGLTSWLASPMLGCHGIGPPATAGCRGLAPFSSPAGSWRAAARRGAGRGGAQPLPAAARPPLPVK